MSSAELPFPDNQPSLADRLDHSLVVLQVESETARILDVTSAAVAFYGWPRATLLAMLLIDVEELSLEAWRAGVQGMVPGQPRRLRRTHRGATGAPRQVESYVRLAEGAFGSTLEVVVHDVTGVAVEPPPEAAAALPTSEQIAHIAGMLAHDFNNLFSVIRGATGFLRDGLEAGSALLDDVAAIERASDHADLLTNRLQRLGRGAVTEPGESSEVTARSDDVAIPVGRRTPSTGPASASGLADLSDPILLVDDDALLRELGRRMLKALGAQVLTAASGTEALALLAERNGACAAVLTDVTMPDMSGAVLRHHLSAQFPTLPVVLMSGLAEPPDDAEAGSTPGALFLAKPFTRDVLLRVLHEALQPPR